MYSRYQTKGYWLMVIFILMVCFWVVGKVAWAGCGDYNSGPEVIPDDSPAWYVCTCQNGNFESYKTKETLKQTCPKYCSCSGSQVLQNGAAGETGMQYCTESPRSSESFDYFCYCKLGNGSIRYSSYRTASKCNCVCDTFCISKQGVKIQGSCTDSGPSDLGGAACGGYGDICNPTGINNVETMIGRIIRTLMGIIGSIALCMFIWAGFIWMTSRGNKEKAQQSQHIMAWAALGLAVIFASYVVLQFVFSKLAWAILGLGTPN